MNVSESLTLEQTALNTKSLRLEELLNDDQTGGGLEAADAQERDRLLTEVDGHTKKISQLKTLEAAQAARGVAIIPSFGVRPQTQHQFKTVELEKGTIFTRIAMAKAAGKGSFSDTLAYARKWEGQTPEVLAFLKAEPGMPNNVGSPNWGSELVNPNTAATEFIELLRPATIIGRIPGFRPAMFNIPLITQTGPSTFEWVGAAAPKPVGELAFTRDTLTWSKVAGIIVLSEELIRLSNPQAEAIVRQDLVRQCAQFLDEQFIQVGVTAGPNNPASVTNGVNAPNATGTTTAALLHDFNIALKTFDDAGLTTAGLVIVMTQALARGISLLYNPGGTAPAFPTMQPDGGTLLGYPVIVSNSVDSGTIVFLLPSQIFLADDGQVRLDASNQATLNMAGGSPNTATFSLWQNNCVGLRAERWIRWQKARDAAVALIDTAAYAPA